MRIRTKKKTKKGRLLKIAKESAKNTFIQSIYFNQ